MIDSQRHMTLLTVTFVLLFRGAVLNAAPMALDGPWVSDSAGRRIFVDKPFERIISLYGAHTENLFSLGAQSQVVGVARNDDWPPETKNKPKYSYRDGLEKILAARPDLVLIRPMIDRGYSRLMYQLETYGIRVVSLQPTNVGQMFLYWQILGRLTGQQTAAREMITQFQDATHCIRKRTDGIQYKKRVYFEAIHDRMRTFSPTAMAIYSLEIAGGINMAHDAEPRRGTTIADYGKERILSRAGDIDVYLAQVGPMNRPTMDTIKKEPGYALIRAVQQNKIYFIDEKLVSRPTLRLLTGIERVGQALYPQIFRDGIEVLGCTRPTNTTTIGVSGDK
jgi:iron complex transport system substrate-binding protein